MMLKSLELSVEGVLLLISSLTLAEIRSETVVVGIHHCFRINVLSIESFILFCALGLNIPLFFFSFIEEI